MKNSLYILLITIIYCFLYSNAFSYELNHNNIATYSISDKLRDGNINLRSKEDPSPPKPDKVVCNGSDCFLPGANSMPFVCTDECTFGVFTYNEFDPDTGELVQNRDEADYYSHNAKDFQGTFVTHSGTSLINRATLNFHFDEGDDLDKELVGVSIKSTTGTSSKPTIFINRGVIKVDVQDFNNDDTVDPTNVKAAIDVTGGDYIKIINETDKSGDENDFTSPSVTPSITNNFGHAINIENSNHVFIENTNSFGGASINASNGNAIRVVNEEKPEILEEVTEIKDEDDNVIGYTQAKTDHEFSIKSYGLNSKIISKNDVAIYAKDAGNVSIDIKDSNSSVASGFTSTNAKFEEAKEAILLEGLFSANITLQNYTNVVTAGNAAAIKLDNASSSSTVAIDNSGDIKASFNDGCISSSTSCDLADIDEDTGEYDHEYDPSLVGNQDSYGIFLDVNKSTIKNTGDISAYNSAVYFGGSSANSTLTNYGNISVEDGKYFARDENGTLTEFTLDAGAAVYVERGDNVTINHYMNSTQDSNINASTNNGIAIELDSSTRSTINIGADEAYREELENQYEDSENGLFPETKKNAYVNGSIFLTNGSSADINIYAGGIVEGNAVLQVIDSEGNEEENYGENAIGLVGGRGAKLNIDNGTIIGNIHMGSGNTLELRRNVFINGDVTLTDDDTVNIYNDLDSESITGTINAEDVEDPDKPGEMIRGDNNVSLRCTEGCTVDLGKFRNFRDLDGSNGADKQVINIVNENVNNPTLDFENFILGGTSIVNLKADLNIDNMDHVDGNLFIYNNLYINKFAELGEKGSTTIVVGGDDSGTIYMLNTEVNNISDDHTFSIMPNQENGYGHIVEANKLYEVYVTEHGASMLSIDEMPVVYEITNEFNEADNQDIHSLSRKTYDSVLDSVSGDYSQDIMHNASALGNYLDNLIGNDGYSGLEDLINDLDASSLTEDSLIGNLRSIVPEDLMALQFSRHEVLNDIFDEFNNYVDSTRLKTYNGRFWLVPSFGISSANFDDYNDINVNYFGASGGYDMFVSKDFRLGIGGSVYGSTSKASRLQNNSYSAYLSPYLTFRHSSWFIDGIITAGAAYNDYDRYTSFSDFQFKGDLAGFDMGSRVDAGYIFGNVKDKFISPVIRYTYSRISGAEFTEVGGFDDIKLFDIDMSNYSTSEISLGVKLGKLYSQYSTTRYYLNGYGLITYNIGDTTMARSTGLYSPTTNDNASLDINHAELAREKLELGISGGVQDKNITFSISYDIDISTDSITNNFGTRVYYKFN